MGLGEITASPDEDAYPSASSSERIPLLGEHSLAPLRGAGSHRLPPTRGRSSISAVRSEATSESRRTKNCPKTMELNIYKDIDRSNMSFFLSPYSLVRFRVALQD